MPNTQRGKLAKQTESHLQDGSYWQQNTSTSSRRTTRPSDPDLTDASEEESRRHNERVDAEFLARANKRQLQEGSSSKDRKREQKRAQVRQVIWRKKSTHCARQSRQCCSRRRQQKLRRSCQNKLRPSCPRSQSLTKTKCWRRRPRTRFVSRRRKVREKQEKRSGVKAS